MAQLWLSTNLTHYHDALAALRLSLLLDPLVSDVWCNLGLAYFGLEEFNSAELHLGTQS